MGFLLALPSTILRCPIESSQELEVPRTGLAAIGDKLEADLLTLIQTAEAGALNCAQFLLPLKYRSGR